VLEICNVSEHEDEDRYVSETHTETCVRLPLSGYDFAWILLHSEQHRMQNEDLSMILYQ
jgi:hypothetical protein